jgi:hypothetical protein
MASPILALMPPAAIPPPRSLSLYTLEADLEALLDTEALVEPEQQLEFNAHLESALATTKNKRDRVNSFLAHLESQSLLATSEIDRLKKRKAFFEAVAERVELSVVRCIKNLGPDAKGKYKTLEGDTVSFGLRRCPPTVAITDEASVPAAFKSISITLPALTWESLLDSLDMETRAKILDEVRKPESSVSKALLKDAIETGVPDWKERLKLENALPVSIESIPGASIVQGGMSLIRK